MYLKYVTKNYYIVLNKSVLKKEPAIIAGPAVNLLCFDF